MLRTIAAAVFAFLTVTEPAHAFTIGIVKSHGRRTQILNRAGR
jgi:hypothetical protein